MISSDSDVGLFKERIDQAGFTARVAKEYSIYIESFLLFEVVPR